ncbi:hypothetical protein Apa02nite_013980 [Actinoplanes palleronii]|uniref:Uncharacterized protein n=1 Tax=Actinoplanes palleronii TaxID=113570 RepID=A0ABQ4B4T2_9ACTN|nr:hypothetical protein Apa02nite_013980 [Actinoplanes palleronii]
MSPTESQINILPFGSVATNTGTTEVAVTGLHSPDTPGSAATFARDRATPGRSPVSRWIRAAVAAVCSSITRTGVPTRSSAMCSGESSTA